ncbi:laccase-like [Ceratina calcarata]|uniref:Laccase-like n=1 Tax=Ceratina calcarata TaxID=156304 RepID=A0AAJ7JDW2_9HYME|nr:laccase-like [Ceratina calcarata]
MSKFSTVLNISPDVTKFVGFFVIFLIHTQLSYSQRFGFGPFWDFTNTDTDIKYSSVPISTPEECARDCTDDGYPRNCYYKFHIEFYTTWGPACNVTGGADQCIMADGFEKTLIPINRRLPGPPIEICLGDRVIVDVENAAAGMEVTLHWHGIFQQNFQYYDGVPYLTQCPIASASTFRYDFVVQNSGTHFYHSHVLTHMLDGQVGPFIVRDPPGLNPYWNSYDVDANEHVIFLTDWMHELSFERYPGWYQHTELLGQTARNYLINGLGNFTANGTTTNGKLAEFTIQSGKRYRMRLINSFSTVCLAEFSIEGHTNLTIIAQDGANVKPKPVTNIVTATGERVDFILNADQSVGTYWINVRGLGECAGTKVLQNAILRYEGGPQRPTSPIPTYEYVVNHTKGVTYNDLNATLCDTNDTSTVVCSNQLEGLNLTHPDLLKVVPDERHILPFWFFNYTDYDGSKQLFATDTYGTFFDANDRSQLISMFNDVEYETPSSPLISQPNAYQTICKKNQPSHCTQPCSCSQVIFTKLNNVVELVIYDEIPVTELHHPFHLHGYEFRVFSIGQFNNGKNISRADIDNIIAEHEQRLRNNQYKIPPGKDTVKIPEGGWSIVRFKATNPGWWLLHCHFSWHHITGMELVIHVGDDSDLPPVPRNFPQCNNWRPAVKSLNHFYKIDFPNYNHV